MDIKDLLMLCISQKASDLHLTENEPAILRIDGKLHRTEHGPFDKQRLKMMIYSV